MVTGTVKNKDGLTLSMPKKENGTHVDINRPVQPNIETKPAHVTRTTSRQCSNAFFPNKKYHATPGP